jgi:CubicO group peptidase (beta-lactamase class C family)
MSLSIHPWSRCLAWSLAALVAIASPSAFAGEAAPQVDLVGKLKPFVDNHTLAGAVTMVVNKDGVLSHQAIGLADIATNKPMPPDALVWIASMSKPLTGTVLMMLVDEGKLDLEAPVAKYLPEFADLQVEVKSGDQVTLKKAERPILVRHVMAHTSGLPFLLPAEKGKIDVLSIADSVAQSAKLPLKFEPGAGWSYSNCGINVGGRIIELVTGKAYEAVMRERLFVPLGMVDTTSFPTAAQLTRLAKSYRPTKDKSALEEIQINYLSYPLDASTRFACPGGGYFSTAQDLGRFARMILNGGELDGRRYLSAAALTQMTSKQTGDLPNGYGIGFSVSGDGYGHGGAYATDLAFERKNGLATIYLPQHNGYAGPDGGKILPTFKQAAVAAFGKK